MIEHRPPEASELDLRSKTVARIWGAMPVILAISIPLEAVTRGHGAIAITALLAAGLSTVAVWLLGGAAVAPTRLKVDDSVTQNRLRELEERLANLEGITNFEHKLLEAKYPNVAPVNAAAPSPEARPLVQDR